MDHFDLRNFDLRGHSMGGGLAIRYAAQHGDRVRRLILCAPPALLNICRTRAYISCRRSATCRRSNRRTNSTR
ncbi:MAG: alpha/beta fold hydrolase [Chloroflexota bacterium]